MAFAFWSYGQLEQANAQGKHTRDVSVAANRLMSALKDAETSQRGYALSGDKSYLEPYLAVREQLDSEFQALRELTRIPQAQVHLDALAPLMSAKLALLDKFIALQNNNRAAAAMTLFKTDEGKHLMDAIRTEVSAFLAIQDQAQLQSIVIFDASMHRLFAILLGFGLVALLLALHFAHASYLAVKQRVQNVLHQDTLEINRALQASEQKLAVTLNSIGDGVVATDAAGCITLLNPVAENLTGWTQAQAQGQPVGDVFHIINKTTRALATIPVARALQHGTIQGLANHTVLIARDGREFDIADSCAPIRDADDQVVGAVLVFRNVTAEYAAQQSVHDSAALVQTILNTVVDGIVTIHAQGGAIESANPAIQHMFGYSADELHGKGLGVLIPELAQVQKHVSLDYYAASSQAQAVGVSREVMGQRKDGSYFPLEIAVSEMTLRGQRYFTGILRDTSTRKQVEIERARADEMLQQKNTELVLARAVAEKANLAKSDFLSSMSHELRSPLNAILGFAQLMESGTPAPNPEQKASINHILRAGWYLLQLINEILDLALIESGKLSMSIEPISLPEILRDCEDMVEPQAAKKGIILRFPKFIAPCVVAADSTRVKQVLVNLLSNAIKYNCVNGFVDVTCALADGQRLRISVRDTGEGLSPRKMAQLFQPFNRLGQEASAEEGTGIGLVMSKRLVELMGGSIGVQTTQGVGSEFWVELNITEPVKLAFDTTLPLSTLSTQAYSQSEVRTLLYVEDNQANMELVAQLLARRPDMNLLRANDGLRGVTMARKLLPDLILMDINLPGISGIQALQKLREDALTRHIPVMALSANAMARDIERGMEAGFFRYLTKPIKIDEFMEALDYGLALAKTRSLAKVKLLFNEK